jgi:hypothetical protein
MLSSQEFKEQLEAWQRLWQPEKLAQLQAEKARLEELTMVPGFGAMFNKQLKSTNK